MTERDHHLLVHGGAFAALGDEGEALGGRGAVPQGLFVRDARHLSRWQLALDGAGPDVLVPASGEGTLRCVLAPRSGPGEPPAYTVFREQAVSDGSLVDQLRVVRNTATAAPLTIALTVDADFADLFELRSDHRTYVKAALQRTREVLPDGVEFGYRRGGWSARTRITADPVPDAVEETGTGARRLVWTLAPDAAGEAVLTLRVQARPGDAPAPRTAPATVADAVARRARTVEEYRAGVRLPASEPALAAAADRGLTDLALLQVEAAGPDGEALLVPGAGVPWYAALFGRDALLTSLFLLPYRSAPAAATLLALAATQALGEQDPADPAAQPGRIVHEVRHGELAHFGQVPYGRYYGSVDATPLFLVLLGAYTEQTGDHSLARRLEPQARAAVGWMLDHGGLATRGYLLHRADEGGHAHHHWKDSPGALCRADGSRPAGAVTPAGAQGYAYDALRRTAQLARDVWGDLVHADLCDQAAADLRDRFQRDFWLEPQGFPALALDAEGHPLDALASDAGHLLWSGLLDKEYGAAVGRRLLEPDFFSGWGVRTLAAGQPAYHPLGYHRGAVWPHDNALVALGLARYGLHDEARRVATAFAQAAALTGGGLPTVAAGYDRADSPAPVPHPYASVRESRVAATPLALLTAVGGV
ncbi:glycogen debranching N-terminal domain-containing protein [Streptomyces sp. NPDC058372]|uniref:amylo-alpha-1,6-glucosidase n=1 Tax=unclassified Streptomyces TaxID=2593676 RepID=UPI003649E105